MSAKDDCDQLLDATVLRAENLLREYGEFYPFGAQMLPSGEIVPVSAYVGDEQPQSHLLIDHLQTYFKARASNGEVVATALAYDVSVTSPASDRKSDAIAVKLDHRDSYSVIVFLPYVIANGEPALGEGFGNIGQNSVFPSDNSSEV